MHASNCSKKPLEVLQIKHVMQDKLFMSIKLVKITISFWKKLFSCIKYFQLHKQQNKELKIVCTTENLLTK